MLRFRDSAGKVYKAPAGIVAIEICNDAGAPGAVVVVKGTGRVGVYTPGDPEFATYCSSFGVSPSAFREVGEDDVWTGGRSRGSTITTV